VAARQLRDIPVTPAAIVALALLAGASAAAAQAPPVRHLESRRASAPVVYLATVAGVADEATPGEPVATVRTMRASLTVERVFRPAPLASPAPAEAIVRYRQRGPGDADLPAELFYQLSPGDRVVVFAPSLEPSFALEIIAGPATAVAAQLTALRAQLAGMDETTARLHGVTPAVRTRQAALYDRILAGIRNPSAP
jgi:hypothetical protein